MTSAANARPAVAVVDDDPPVLAAIAFALEAEGYAVRAYAAAEALLASGRLGDLSCMVIDLRLPDGDGLSLIRRLRGQGVTAPAILVTSQPDARRRREAHSLGAPIIEKPLMGDALSDGIRAAIRGAA